MRKPLLTKQYKEARLQFAEKYMHWFIDEKRFTLDGSDGYRCYFHDLHKEQQILCSRQCGGGRVMVWPGIGYYGHTEIKFIKVVK